MNKWSRPLALLLLLGMVFSFAGCSAARQLHASPIASRTVAKAGNTEIYYDEVYYLAQNYIAERCAAAGDAVMDSEEERAALRAFVEENLITRERALRVVGETYGVSVDKGDVAASVQDYIEELIEVEFAGDRKAYIASLDKAFLTDRYVRADVGTQEFLAVAIVKEMIADGSIDTSNEAARALIESDDFIHTVQVFISKDNGRSDEENRATAARLYDEIRAAGDETARYAAMRKAIGGIYNNDYGDMGNGYYFTRGEMSAAYETAAFSLSDYEVSPVVETADGFFLIMRLPKDETYIETNFQSLKEQSYFIRLNDEVDNCYAEMTLEWTKAGAALDLANLPAIRANGGAFLAVLPWVLSGVAAIAVLWLVIVLVRRKKKTTAKITKKKKR